jgi:hypothetical protein
MVKVRKIEGKRADELPFHVADRVVSPESLV